MSTLDQQLDRLLAEPDACVVVIAPHPDDETLACGALLQRACDAGARVAVVLLTDGDNNPWPQRWLERRWRIDGAARAAWGERRRGEALMALGRLGVPPECLHAMGWPDQGLTARIGAQLAGSVASLRDRLVSLRPTLVVAPVLEDRHPDHSAARVLVELALARWPGTRPVLWGFAVHGAAVQPQALAQRAAERDCKLHALDAHTSQLALGGGRWRRRIEAGECYVPASAPARCEQSRIDLPWGRPLVPLGGLQLLVACGEQSWTLPWREGAAAGPLRLHLAPQPQLEFDQPPRAPVFVKLFSTRRSVWIFDRWGWRDACQAAVLTLPDDSASLA